MRENNIDNKLIIKEKNQMFFDRSMNFKKTKGNIEALVLELPIATILYNLNKRVEIWNHCAEKLFGWNANEVIGEPSPIVQAEKQEEFNRFFQLAIEGELTIDREIIRQRKDGSLVDVCLSTAPYYDSEGYLSGYLATYQDISDRKKKDQEIKDIKFALEQCSIVSVTDVNGSITYVNDMFCDIYQFTREEVIGQNQRIINSGLHSKEFFQELWSSIQSGVIWRGEVRNKAKDGKIYWMDSTIIPFMNEDGEPQQYIAIRKDITERKKIGEEVIKKQEQLRLSEERFRSLVQYSYDGITIIDENAMMTYLSPSIKKFGYKIEDLLGGCLFDFLHPEDQLFAKSDFIEALNNPGQQKAFEYQYMHKDGSWWDCEGIYTNLLHDPSVNGIVINYRDITENKNAKQRIENLASYDVLTGLPNKKLFKKELIDELEKARVKNTQFSVMHVDIDRFKNINDTLGNDIGDQLLIEIVNRLKNTTATVGFLARIVGDEFIILLKNTDFELVGKLALDLITLFEKPFFINTHEIYITISIGISIYPFSGNSVNGLMKNAATALEDAKHQGKNNFQFYKPTMDVHSFKTFTLQNDLRKAMKNGEFILHYQPQVDIKTKKIVGVEALIRWKHPEWGIVSPNKFIPFAEETGLIDSIGEWVLDNACRQNKKWQEIGLPPITMSVNISPRQFIQQNLFEKIKDILEKTELDPHYLMIELTENALIEEETIVLSTISKLKKLGIKIAIDDFGTGYSSLIYLNKFKFDCLKIDRSFIKDLTVDVDCKKITSAIINLGKDLNMTIVAEGVETLEQFTVVQELNCDHIQGYYFSKPVGCEDFQKLLGTGVCEHKEDDTVVVVENRRQFFRIEPNHPFCSYMTIVKLSGKNVSLGNTKILVQNISGCGLSFITNIKLPVRPDMVICIQTKLLGRNFDLLGSVLWSSQTEDDYYQYGMKFNLNEFEQSNLIKILNQLQVEERKQFFNTNVGGLQPTDSP